MIRLFGKDIFPATTTHDLVAAEPSKSPNSSSSSPSSSGGKNKRKTSSEPYEGKKKQKKKQNKQERYEQVPTVELPSEFQEWIGKNGPAVFVYRKKLTTSDVEDSQNRLLVTRKEKLVGEYLTAEERVAFVGRGANIDGIGIDRTGREYKLRLSKWGEEKKITILNDQWCKLIAANGAKAGHWVDLWGFRRPDQPKLCFAVNFST